MRNFTDHERRLSFRINDRARVELATLPDGASTTPLNTHFNTSIQFQLLTDLQQLDNEFQHQLFKLTESNAVLATALQLLNRKIERLALQASTDERVQLLQPISLSEGGLSLDTQQPLITDSLCAVRLRLLPAGYALQSYARVIYCQDLGETGHRVGLQFIALDETGRDLIARHLLEHQAHNRRVQRQQRDVDAPL